MYYKSNIHNIELRMSKEEAGMLYKALVLSNPTEPREEIVNSLQRILRTYIRKPQANRQQQIE